MSTPPPGTGPASPHALRTYQSERDERLRCDAVAVAPEAGGGVAAAELSAAGLSVGRPGDERVLRR